jgi:hypothetical protein
MENINHPNTAFRKSREIDGGKGREVMMTLKIWIVYIEEKEGGPVG